MPLVRRLRWPFAAAAGLLLVVAVLTAVWWTRRAKAEDAETAELPPSSGQAAAVQGYFRGEGAPLVPLLNATIDLDATSTKEDCSALATRLDGLGGPTALADKALAVPDPGVRDAAFNHVESVGRYLADCGAGRPLASAASKARFSAVILRRLLVREKVL